MVRRVPVGVVGAITPWNSPSVLGMRVVAPALALGNAVVLKPDPQTPVCGGAVFAAIFREAGLPDGLLQIVIGDAEAGEALVTDPNVDMVSFTGSTEVGRRVGALAGGLLKKVSLELGGNNPLRGLDDADLEAAASAGAYSSLPVPGPGLLRHGPPHRPSLGRRRVRRAAGAQKARRLRTGDPYREDVELGPIVNERQLARVDDIVQRSVARRRAARRGRHLRGPLLPADRAGRRHDRRCRRGPTRSSGRSRRWSASTRDDEAVALANDSEYGLAAGVYSRSISRGLAIANRIRAGMVHVNDQTINDEAIIPFGGMGISGNGGRFGGEANLEAFTQWQWVTVRDEPRSFGPTY